MLWRNITCLLHCVFAGLGITSQMQDVDTPFALQVWELDISLDNLALLWSVYRGYCVATAVQPHWSITHLFWSCIVSTMVDNRGGQMRNFHSENSHFQSVFDRYEASVERATVKHQKERKTSAICSVESEVQFYQSAPRRGRFATVPRRLRSGSWRFKWQVLGKAREWSLTVSSSVGWKCLILPALEEAKALWMVQKISVISGLGFTLPYLFGSQIPTVP